MRILAIRGRNLASLARTFAVELASGELADAGLFAITGPVGAGKSTLLDALCLALFDRTPRLTGRGGTFIGDEGQDRGDWLRANDPRTLLRRNAVDGYAEVDFVGRDGVPYRSRWSVRRARRKPDGRLQDQELVLWDLAKDVVVANGRRTEVVAAIQERLGLDFGQFCRSVLLAQGEFHAFLHASADERAKLLETLTGAKVYRQLSRRAHEKKREHDKAVGLLNAKFEQCEVMTDELRSALTQQAEGLTKQLEVCDLGIKVAQNYVLWHQAAETHRGEEGKATAALQKAVDANVDATSRRERLQANQRAMAAIPRWEVVVQARKKLDAVRAEVAKVQQAIADAETLSTTATARLTQLLEPQFGRLDETPPMIRDLPQWRASLERWHETECRIREADEQAAECKRALAGAERRCEHLREEVQRLDAAFERAEALLKQADKDGSEADYDQIAARRRQLSEQQVALERESSALRQWQAAQQARTTARSAHTKVTAEADALQPDRGVARLELQARDEALAKCREDLRVAEQKHGLAALRSELVDGHECPLCGATEHPAQAHEIADLLELRESVASSESKLEEARRRVTAADLAWQKMQADVARRHEELRKSEAALEDAARECANASEQAGVELASRRGKWREEDERLQAVEADAARRSQALREARDARTKADEARAAARGQADAADKARRDAAQALASAQALAERSGDVLREIFRSLEPACECLRDGVQAIAALGEQRLQTLEQMYERDQAAVTSRVALSKAREQEQLAADRERTAREELESFEQAFRTALTVNDVTEQDVATAYRLGAEALHLEAAALQALTDEVARCRTELSLRVKLRREHEDHDRPTLDAAEALQALEDAQKDRTRVEKSRLEVHGKIMMDDASRARREKLQPELDRATRELEVWRALSDLIGSSLGDAFAVFAQGLTLDLLLLEANRRLEELARRYRLEKSRGGELDFVVVDLDMGGTRRSLHTLSGGETFLVSLSLALALATLAAPRSRVETLFLDEGFGTLDAQNLEIALGALDSLQSTGCQVGLISHVDGIAERVGAVVEVRPEGSGQSRVLARSN